MRTDQISPKFSAEHVSRRDRTLSTAIAVGKIPSSEWQRYAAMYDADPVGTAKLLDQLYPALTASATGGQPGQGVGEEPPAEPAYPAGMLSYRERTRLAGQSIGGKLLHDGC
jgi:hypothetical protein